MTKVGVLGLGLMGRALCQNLLSKKHEVHIYNRTESKIRELVDKGAIAHATPFDLGRSVDIAITLVTDQNAIDDVAMGDKGLLRGMKKGSLWIDMSTVDPDASKRHAQECHRLGIARLDSPVAGGPQWIAEGKVTLFVGGRKEAFEKYQPFLSQLASSVLYLGDEGNGHKMKLLINLYLAMVAVSFVETMTLSQKLDFAPEVFVNTVNKTVHKSYFSEVRASTILKGDYRPAFTLKNLLKDLMLAENQAKRHGAVLPASTLTTELFRAAVNLGYGETDYTSIALVLKKLNGLE